MARPVNANPQATRQRILDAARAAFSVQGPHAVGLRDVARKAGVGLATVTHYFPTKRALEDAVVADVVAALRSLRAELMPLLEDGPRPEEALRRVVRAALQFVRSHLGEVRMLMRLVVDVGEAQEDVLRVFLPVLDQGGDLLAAVSGAPRERGRMVLLSLNHLVIRYGLTDPRELLRVTGVDAALPDAEARAWTRVEEHLVDMVLSTLGVTRSG